MKTIEAKHPLRSFGDLKALKLEWGTNLDFLWWLSFAGDEGPLERRVG